MLRRNILNRNLDAIAIALVCLGMAVVGRIQPPSTPTAKVIHLQNAAIQDRCPLLETILSHIH
jgi:hypothetical protein